MTFQEKYEELYARYRVTGQELTAATEALANLNGFGEKEMNRGWA